MSVKIEWYPEGYLRELHATLGNMLDESADVVKDNAKEECPVKTGALKADIKQYTDKQELKAEIGNDLYYSIFVELGTRKMAPRGYLRKGLMKSINAIKAIFGG